MARSGRATKLYNAWRKHGDPILDVVWEGPCESLLDMERHFVSLFDAYEGGYNSTTGGEVSPMKFGCISDIVNAKRTEWARTPEGRAKLSAAQKAKRVEFKEASTAILRRPDVVAKCRAAAATPEARAAHMVSVNTPEAKAIKSAATSDGWASGRFASKCLHPCSCDGTSFDTVGKAFKTLGLKYSASRGVRRKMLTNGLCTYTEGGRTYTFQSLQG